MVVEQWAVRLEPKMSQLFFDISTDDLTLHSKTDRKTADAVIAAFENGAEFETVIGHVTKDSFKKNVRVILLFGNHNYTRYITR